MCQEGVGDVGTEDLITRARDGDGEAFEELTQPYCRELQVHCYRMLGSFQDAEDVLQDSLLAAWQGLGDFEERAVPSDLAVQDRDEPMPQRAPLSGPASGKGVGRARG